MARNEKNIQIQKRRGAVMRLSYGVDGHGNCFVVDDDRNPHKAISGKLSQFYAKVFIERTNRKARKAKKR